MSDLIEEIQRLYNEGDLPWDQPLPPPEVIDLAAELTPGRALDLGCGYGRTCIYLARHGWRCDGIDFVPRAIACAQERSRRAGVEDCIRFYLASVTRLDFLDESYDLAIDVGCLHAQRGDDLQAYATHLARLLRPDGRYLLFARLLDDPDKTHPRALPEQAITTLFAACFTIERIEHGTTAAGDREWPSAWFWMRRVPS